MILIISITETHDTQSKFMGTKRSTSIDLAATQTERRFHRSYRNRPEKVTANPSEQHLVVFDY